MKKHHTRWLLFTLLMALLGSAQAAEDNVHIRTLAASCAACHGTNGNSVGGTPVLAGLDQRHFISQMLAFRSGERPATVMHRHAKGLTPEEIEQLASYFAAQKRTAATTPTPVE
jgi:cytochrome c553